jgi:CelD/BcsL family acetyltransferase involved in cellulose biosynthesis
MTTAMASLRTETSSSSFAVSAHRGTWKLVDELADEWRELCDEATDDQPFYRPEWIRAFYRILIPRLRVVIITVRQNGRLQLVLPLIELLSTFSKVPVRKMASPVNSCAGRFDAIYSAGPQGEAAIQATWNYFKDLDTWDVLSFRDAIQGSAVSRIAAAAQADGLSTIQLEDRPTPLVAIPEDPELLKQMPVNSRLRRQLRQIRRQIAEKGLSLKLHRVETADANALNRFYQLEASGWKGQERTAILLFGRKPFLDEVAESASRAGYLTLYLLELNGELIAGHYGFTHRACYYSVVVAYNENFKEFSPGHLIIDEIVHDCNARGIRAYQTTGQDQEWKMRWATQLQPVNHHYIFRGRMGNLAYAVESKLRPGISRLLARRNNEENHMKQPEFKKD